MRRVLLVGMIATALMLCVGGCGAAIDIPPVTSKRAVSTTVGPGASADVVSLTTETTTSTSMPPAPRVSFVAPRGDGQGRLVRLVLKTSPDADRLNDPDQRQDATETQHQDQHRARRNARPPILPCWLARATRHQCVSSCLGFDLLCRQVFGAPPRGISFGISPCPLTNFGTENASSQTLLGTAAG